MSWLAIKHKKTKLFYNDMNWVTLDKARLFKRGGDLTNFLKSNNTIKYHTKRGLKGLVYFEGDYKTKITEEKDFEIVSIKLVEIKNVK